MKLILANPQTFAPFHYSTWEKVRPDAWELVHGGTLFLGEEGRPLSPTGSKVELRLESCRWARAPEISGGVLSGQSDQSIFVDVIDHMIASKLAADLTGIAPGSPSRVGTPVVLSVLVDSVLVRSLTLGYIGGVSTSVVPFFNPPTNPRQQTVLVLNNHENENVVRVIAVDAKGVVRHGDLATLSPGVQAIVEAGEVYAAVGAAPVAGNKLRLIVCSSAPLTVVSKVRDSDSGIMCDNAVREG